MTTHLIPINDFQNNYNPFVWATTSTVSVRGEDYSATQIPTPTGLADSGGSLVANPASGDLNYPLSADGDEAPGWYTDNESLMNSDALLGTDNYGIVVGQTLISEDNCYGTGSGMSFVNNSGLTIGNTYNFGVTCLPNTFDGRAAINNLLATWGRDVSVATGVTGVDGWPGAVALPDESDTPSIGSTVTLTAVHKAIGTIATSWSQADPTSIYSIQWTAPWIDGLGGYVIHAADLLEGPLTFTLTGTVNTTVDGGDLAVTCGIGPSATPGTNPWYISLLDEAKLDFVAPPTLTVGPYIPQRGMNSRLKQTSAVFIT